MAAVCVWDGASRFLTCFFIYIQTSRCTSVVDCVLDLIYYMRYIRRLKMSSHKKKLRAFMYHTIAFVLYMRRAICRINRPGESLLAGSEVAPSSSRPNRSMYVPLRDAAAQARHAHIASARGTTSDPSLHTDEESRRKRHAVNSA